MAEIVQKPVRSVYKDGSIVVSNVKSKIDNSTTSYTVVDNWYDGTPMNDSKVDQFGIYSKFKETGEYLRENKPQWGELFLEIDTMSAFRQMSPLDQHLVIIGYYKGVKLNGYYTKGDTPAPIDYYISNSTKYDNSGNIIDVQGVKFEYDYKGVLNVLYFGVIGDGVTGNYSKLLRLSEYINTYKEEKLTLIYPPNTHIYIEAKGETGKPAITDIGFTNLNDLTVIGYGCKISVNATMHRTTSLDRSVVPFVFNNCKNLIVRGFELNGNSQDATKVSTLSEGASYGLILNSCIGALVEDCYMHNFMTDGIRINGIYVAKPEGGSQRTASKNIVLKRVTSNANGRLGMSIIQCRGGYFENCIFNDSGRTGGYGAHSPVAGVDVEPNRSIGTPAPDNMDVNTGELLFYKCEFINNMGATFVTALPKITDTITLDECKFITGYRGLNQGGDGLIIDTNGGVLKNSYINLEDKYFYAAGYRTDPLTSLLVTGCVFESRVRAILSHGVTTNLVVDNNRFIARSDSPIGDYLIYIRNPKAIFRNNYIFIPEGAWRNGGSGDRHIVNEVSVGISENNIFETDLSPTYLGSTSAHFANLVASGYSYPTRNDTYKGTTPGTADTFRPSFNATFNSNFKYSNGPYSVGFINLRWGSAPNGREGQINYNTSRPTITKNQGDIALNATPNITTLRNMSWITTSANVVDNNNIPSGFVGEYSGTVNPNGVEQAAAGARYTQLVGTTGILWIKKVGNDNQGWETISEMKTGKAISDIATSNATTPETTMALVNELKAKINELLQDRRDTKQQSLI